MDDTTNITVAHIKKKKNSHTHKFKGLAEAIALEHSSSEVLLFGDGNLPEIG